MWNLQNIDIYYEIKQSKENLKQIIKKKRFQVIYRSVILYADIACLPLSSQKIKLLSF